MPDDLPSLTRSDVRNWTEDRFFQRGEGYFNQGRIQRPRRTGTTLKADCQGSRPSPYHVEAELDADGIADAHCSCPMGSGGYCKHVVALLLTWVDEPDAFAPRDPLRQQIDALSRETLCDLVLEMVDRHPDLERLVTLSTQSTAPLDEAVVRDQIQSVFERKQYGSSGDRWQTAVDTANELDDFLALGSDYRDHGRLADAVTVYRSIAEEACDHYMHFHDESGALAMQIDTCTDALASILDDTDDSGLRRTILRALWEVRRWDIETGGFDIGHGGSEALREKTTTAEKETVADWVREALPRTEDDTTRTIVLGESSASEFSRNWKRNALGGLLLDLEAHRLDDETYLDICRETGRVQNLVDRLLELDRVDEALDTLRTIPDLQVLRQAPIFADHDHADAFLTHVRDRLDANSDRRLVAWLRDQERERGHLDRALELTERLFWDRPSTQRYETLRAIAQELDRWDAVQASVHDELRDRDAFATLTRMHLNDGDVGRALDTHRNAGDGSWRYSGVSLTLNVAEAAEDDHPDDAIRLYRKRARALIDQRGRDNYADAARLMQRVKALYERMNQSDVWTDVIDTLVDDELHRLPAARDEFQQADLL
jgi:uncharacterized Zn finger protein